MVKLFFFKRDLEWFGARRENEPFWTDGGGAVGEKFKLFYYIFFNYLYYYLSYIFILYFLYIYILDSCFSKTTTTLALHFFLPSQRFSFPHMYICKNAHRFINITLFIYIHTLVITLLSIIVHIIIYNNSLYRI